MIFTSADLAEMDAACDGICAAAQYTDEFYFDGPGLKIPSVNPRECDGSLADAVRAEYEANADEFRRVREIQREERP